MPRIEPASLRLCAAPTLEHIDRAALAEYPPSYRAFIEHAGWGRLFGLWLIYPPVRDGIVGRGAHLDEQFRLAYEDGREEDFDWMIEPDGDWQTAARLRVFGWSENGDALLWDPASTPTDTASPTHAGEYPIWESRGLNALHRIGDDLGEALASLRERNPFASEVFDLEPLRADRI
ncbi:hypothetical protein [Microbacterium dauci]|uniref:SMI1/KNR4 family protein n=1 Tax=Microbacterium dauci TaxID=3048008 RepID=A0ABT6ZFH2_9MICO|nr:hypothetical protein [Microbacterium sp. LX3-4]MDJ1114909.1 hypothetical protein [Microbacterium sp. LX3-4]